MLDGIEYRDFGGEIYVGSEGLVVYNFASNKSRTNFMIKINLNPALTFHGSKYGSYPANDMALSTIVERSS